MLPCYSCDAAGMIYGLQETAKEKDMGIVTQSEVGNDLQMLPQKSHQATPGHPAMKMSGG